MGKKTLRLGLRNQSSHTEAQRTQRKSENLEVMDEWNLKKHGRSMKKVNPDELRPEYSRDDLGRGIRGKHYDDYKSGTNLVLLSPDVAAIFPDDDAVNNALRDLIKIANKSVSLIK